MVGGGSRCFTQGLGVYTGSRGLAVLVYEGLLSGLARPSKAMQTKSEASQRKPKPKPFEQIPKPQKTAKPSLSLRQGLLT